MKIAIYQGDARVCGPSAWIEHMKTGFIRNGHECHIVTSTKSGKTPSHYGNVKPGGHWWMRGPDVCVKQNILHNTFDDYDLVILPEPKLPLADKVARKLRDSGENEAALPFYVEALGRTRTKFTTALHGNPYTDTNAPFAGDILALPNFSGTIIGHTAPLRTVSESMSQYPQVDIPLPYTTRVDVDADYPVNRTVGITGRFMFNKGSHVLGLAGQYLPPDVTVEVWGSCSTGRGPSLTFNLTADRYTSGMEFSTMEALDAGSLCITQDNVSSDPAYRTLVMKGWNGPAGSVKTAFEKRPEETKQVAEKVMEVFDYFSANPEAHRDVVRHNRQALRDNCSPELVARRVLEECV